MRCAVDNLRLPLTSRRGFSQRSQSEIHDRKATQTDRKALVEETRGATRGPPEAADTPGFRPSW